MEKAEFFVRFAPDEENRVAALKTVALRAKGVEISEQNGCFHVVSKTEEGLKRSWSQWDLLRHMYLHESKVVETTEDGRRYHPVIFSKNYIKADASFDVN